MPKRKSGARTKTGRLKNRVSPFDHGTEAVQARTLIFARFPNYAPEQTRDPIGRAYVTGLLENDRIDPATLRDMGRDYARRYWGYWGTSAGVANYQGECRRGAGLSDPSDPDPFGEGFERMDARFGGFRDRNAVQSLCVDPYHFPDNDPYWLARLLNERLARMRLPVAGLLPCKSDYDTLADALAGLLALSEGVRLRRAA